MRALILGPPASGKTTVAKQLCEHYKLHHIKIKDVIDEAIEKLVSGCKYILDMKVTLAVSSKIYDAA